MAAPAALLLGMGRSETRALGHRLVQHRRRGFFGLVGAFLGVAFMTAPGEAFLAPVHRPRGQRFVALRARGGESVSVKGDIAPLGSHILVRLQKPEEMTATGLVLPKRGKPNEGEIIAIGPGEPNRKTGELEAVSVAPGSRVMYANAYFDKFDIEGVEHGLLREDEILLSYTGEELVEERVSMPRGRALVKLSEPKQETDSGLLLSKGAADDSSSVGLVVAVGEGDAADVAKGDVVRFRYGNEVKFKAGKQKDKYMSVRLSDCIAKAKAGPAGAA